MTTMAKRALFLIAISLVASLVATLTAWPVAGVLWIACAAGGEILLWVGAWRGLREPGVGSAPGA